ncbi:cobyrinic acid a,c-diamide synthase [Pseudoroseomonas rhizosphaerae]|uniref:Cobyrinic acid a,c-diamide synthase n=1 Tax=Teichococcus rhizosphaerae TaxID=1335062 RepID=A0A2C7ACW4_9PROT|nr:ParA family partition ATPase [Pseudoroseomonas rhizosphaerae]PHK96260.1 cobyrinic acid a,c-diamide synthase [Pseudoroseomonas rhizosphaerae]
MALVVAVAQRKGGAGKSTVAATLATALAAAGHRVALLDSDPQQTLARWHQARHGQAQAAPLRFEAVAGWRMPAALDRLRREHDFLIIDTPPHADTDSRIAIRAADLVLVPLQPSPADLWAMDATLELAAAERRPVRLLMNRVPASGRLRGEIAAELAERGLPVLEPALGNRTAFASAFAQGLGVAEAAPRGTAATEARALARAIEDHGKGRPA